LNKAEKGVFNIHDQKDRAGNRKRAGENNSRTDPLFHVRTAPAAVRTSNDEPKAPFIAAENFDQLHDNEPSSQCAALDRSTDSLAPVAGKLVGVITIGGPTLAVDPVGCCVFSESA
jgi:hypothetical protein